MRKERINYDIEPELLEQIKNHMKETNLSRNQVISKAVKYWIENKKMGR